MYNTAMTKYEYIAEQIISAINNGTYQAGTNLPSEAALMQTYACSRDTVRKALQLLVEHGHVQKMQGRASRVLPRQRVNFPVSGVVSFKELAKHQLNISDTQVLKLELRTASRKESELFNLEAGKEAVYEVIRLRKIANEPVIIDRDVFPKLLVPELTTAICENSIYEYLEEQLNLNIACATKEISCQRPTALDRQYLDLADYNLIVQVNSLTYLSDTRLIQITSSHHRPDRFQFIDFARRTKDIWC